MEINIVCIFISQSDGRRGKMYKDSGNHQRLSRKSWILLSQYELWWGVNIMRNWHYSISLSLHFFFYNNILISSSSDILQYLDVDCEAGARLTRTKCKRTSEVRCVQVEVVENVVYTREFIVLFLSLQSAFTLIFVLYVRLQEWIYECISV